MKYFIAFNVCFYIDHKQTIYTFNTMDGTRAADVLPLLQERLAILPGGRDRRGGPVIVFPTTPRRERAKPEDYRRLLQYLLAIPDDETRDLGFTVIVDMRGATWDSVKTILKVLL